MKFSTKKELEFETLYKSLVGNTIEITNSKNKNQIGIKGKIIHESANFFVLAQKARNIRILKRSISFKTTVQNKPLYIDGRFLLSTLTNRIKKLK